MTIIELEESLMQEHYRDKKLTTINAIVMTIVVILTASMILYFGLADFVKKVYSGDPTIPAFWKFAIPGVAIAYVGFTLYSVLKLNKRPQKIEEMLSKLKAGSKVVNIMQHIEYKIQIPLVRVVKLYLYPIDFMTISLEGEFMKYYKLPVERDRIVEIKTVLSGADMQAVQNVWDEMSGIETNSSSTKEIHEVGDIWEEESETEINK